MSSQPRLRFAPSPTGYLHIGGARTALFNWLYARRHGGVFVLRVEDTDRERSTDASVRAILDGLKWLGMDWDEGPEKGGEYGPYFQSERLALYQKYADQLLAEGKAYRCYCTKEEIDARRAIYEKEKRTYKYEGTCRSLATAPHGRSSVIRLKMPSSEGSISFDDLVLGPITKELSDLDDWVMVRADGMPVYNFGCVIDDHTMEITHVGRGQEHVNSTFPQLLLYQALGWQTPKFAHFPLILGPDREKLSKRKHPEADVMLHRQNGIMPEALRNFVARLGWSHGDDETFTLEQMIEWFDFSGVGSTSGVWSPDKLLWVNQHWLKTLDPMTVAARLRPFIEGRYPKAAGMSDDKLHKLVFALRERAKTLVEMAEMAWYFFSDGVTLDAKAATKHLTPEAGQVLKQVRDRLSALSAWEAPELEAQVKAVAEACGIGLGKVAQPVRVAVTGGTASPGIGETLELIGRDEALRRLDAAAAR